MVKLICAIVGAASNEFEVNIDNTASVSALKVAIKAKNPNDMKGIDADRLELFLAKTEGGAWLSSQSDDVKKLKKGEKTALIESLIKEDQQLQAEDPLEYVLRENSMVTPQLTQIHVLVLVPGQRLSLGAAALREPHPVRKKRWKELNEVLDRNKRSKVNSAGESSTGYSYVSFADVDKIMRTRRYEQPSKVVENDKLDMLYAYLLLLPKAFGDIVTGKESKKLHFIVPILACVCGHFDGEVRILAEKTVTGKRVHGDGSFEFVIERGSKRVCIVQAKRDDFQQGLAQAYVGCEVLADVEGLTKLYSIVTNYKEWYFSRSLDDRIERFDVTMDIVNDIPTRESVKMIAEKIYSMLSDDDEPAVASNEAIL
ncbi:hypothetical protein Plhal703r1_c17g0081511 [Plasmopara halstedii]